MKMISADDISAVGHEVRKGVHSTDGHDESENEVQPLRKCQNKNKSTRERETTTMEVLTFLRKQN